jgi:flagellar biosynthesis regulator FlbT
MTLRLTLKPGEAVLIGTTRLTVVSRGPCTVILEGNAPVMRAAECIDEAEATDPLSRYRYVLQEIYLRNDLQSLQLEYITAASRLIAAQPEMLGLVERANAYLQEGALWEAVRLGRYAGRGGTESTRRAALTEPSPMPARERAN